MNSNEIMNEVNKIFIDVLDNDDIVLNRETTSDDLEEWDSLNHIQLVVAIEKKFQMRFNSSEVQSWKDVGEMCDSIASKLAAK